MHDFQERFFSSLMSDEIDLALANAPIPGHMGLRVHRDNVILGLTEALGSQFPVVRRLVGDQFFAMTAAEFLREHMPVSPVMIGFGEAFPGFLSTFPPADALPYLADVARLEFEMHAAYHAADAVPVSREALLEISSENLNWLRLVFHPSVRLLSSPFPVDIVWRMNQPGTVLDETVNLPDRGAFVLLARPDDVVETRLLTAPAFAFVSAMGAGEDLEQAQSEAGEDFDGGGLLLELLDDGLIARLTV